MKMLVWNMLLAGFVFAEAPVLGHIEFENSGAAEAQGDFLEGLGFLHNFEYRDAAAAFTRAQEKDPDFAMAYWGEAMTYNHPLWFEQAKQPAEDALRKLGRTPEARAAKAPTQREKDYLQTVEILYGQTEETKRLPKEARDDAYAEAMRQLYERYPQDANAAAFYGLAILGATHEGRDFAAYMRAAAVLEGVWEADREHPGAAHYLIHSYDDPVHAPLGLPMARVYSKIASGAPHAQHMTSHIFVALGMWDDLVLANEQAKASINARKKADGERSEVTGHYLEWLLYGYLQRGEIEKAAALMDEALARMQDTPKEGERASFATMRARYVLDTEDWAAAERYTAEYKPGARGSRDFAFLNAYVAVKRGDAATAREQLELLKLATNERDVPGDTNALPVMVQEIEGLLLSEEGKTEEGIEALKKAVAMETGDPFASGPPRVAKPSLELLGEALAALGRNEEASEAFEAQLARTPGRALAVEGKDEAGTGEVTKKGEPNH